MKIEVMHLTQFGWKFATLNKRNHYLLSRKRQILTVHSVQNLRAVTHVDP